MSALACALGFLALFAPQAAQDGVSARLEAVPAQAEIGQPLTWTLTVDAPKNTKLTLPEKDPLPDGSWVLIAPRTLERAVGADPEHVRTTVRWNVISLEAGERVLPGIELELANGSQKQKLVATAGTLHVASALGPNEDAARAEKGFLPPREASPLTRSWGWIVVAGFALLVLAWSVARVRRRKHVVRVSDTPLDRLRILESSVVAEPESSRETVYALSRLLRDTVDRWSLGERAGLTDEDWARAVECDERVPLGVRSAAKRVLAATERVKYAGEMPTRFAVDELVRDARAVLETLEREPTPAPAAPQAVEVAA